MSNTRLMKADLLHWLRRECDRAIENAETRLDEDAYLIKGGLFTEVTIRAASKDGSKISKHFKVGEAVNLYQWEESDGK